MSQKSEFDDAVLMVIASLEHGDGVAYQNEIKGKLKEEYADLLDEYRNDNVVSAMISESVERLDAKDEIDIVGTEQHGRGRPTNVLETK